MDYEPPQFTEAQIAEGGHVLSEILNDNASLGERRYADALRQALAAMAKVHPDSQTRNLF